jgi:predicted Zn-dependent peptidase
MPAPKIHTYPNGLRVVYESPTPKLPQTYIRAFCHVGSIHEPTNIKGAAHFIEHMCFKGTRHFPSWRAVNDPLSNSGSFFNASTEKQYTVYKINCLESHVPDFLRILADMMLLPKFDKTEYALEKHVVKEEVQMHQPTSYIEKMLFSGTPYANWIDHASFHGQGCLPYDAVVEFYHKYYIPQNMVISIVSSIPFASILRTIASTIFAKHAPCPRQIAPILNSVPASLQSLLCESRYTFKPTNAKTTRVEIGVRICDQFQTMEHPVLNVLRNIIGGSMSSRLFVELREKRGLTYNSGAYISLYEPAGVFIIHATTDTSRLLKDGSNPGVVPTLFGVIDDLILRGVKESEVKHAKTRIREQLQMRSIAGEGRSGYNGIRVMLHNEDSILTNAQMYERLYKDVEKRDIDEIIQKYFASKQFYFSVIGGKLPKRSELTKFL